MIEEATGTHRYVSDPRNDSVLIDIDGMHYPRPEAKVSRNPLSGRASRAPMAMATP